MLKRNKVILVYLLLHLSQGLFADNRSEIYSAYIQSRMDIWKSIIDKMEASASKSNEFILELTDYQYGYIGYCLGFDKEDEARKYLTLAEKNADILEEAGYNLSRVYAYKSAFYGFRIALNKISAPFNGPKSINLAKKAIAIDSTNYSGYVQYGNAHFYMPSAFGGSKQVAFENFNKARKLMEKDPGFIKDNWNYISLLVTIAQSYTYLEEYEKAKAEYENLLRIVPDFLYVRNELYPKLLTKMKK